MTEAKHKTRSSATRTLTGYIATAVAAAAAFSLCLEVMSSPRVWLVRNLSISETLFSFAFLFAATLPGSLVISAVPCVLTLLVPPRWRARALWRFGVVGAVTGSIVGSAFITWVRRYARGEDEPSMPLRFIHCLLGFGPELVLIGAALGMFYWWMTRSPVGQR